ncbi:hypothetical protein [Ferrimonas sp. YFM]|nr:hypothetical protein [Ferrimonas sp. YFM]BDY05423.1 hypothetical protein F0521_24640 [Ferrimonas sp. YFM]
MTVETFVPGDDQPKAEQPNTTHATKVAPAMGQGSGSRIGFISLGCPSVE